MSTRCNIIIEDTKSNKIQFYHHCDGYPEGVGEHLKELTANYKGEHSVAAYADALEASEAKTEFNNAFEREYHGRIHGDIEYLYIVSIESDCTRVLCYDVNWDFKDAITEKGKTINESNIIMGCNCVIDEVYELPELTLAEAVTEAVAAVTPAAFEDEELIAELRKRGYVGTLTKQITVTL